MLFFVRIKIMKKRLDLLIVERGLAESRTKAQALIMAGQVSVDGKAADKAGLLIEESSDIEVEELYPYVSRGASKLEKAFYGFNLDFKDKVIMDIGSSTGGFTDFVLQNGAKKVFAVDVGRGQLAQKIREDSRVVVMEKTDFRNITDLSEKIDYFLCDVSFISIRHILPHILTLQNKEVEVIALVKPQFEAGVKYVTQGKGVIKSEQKRQEIVEAIKEFAQDLGYKVAGLAESPITGAKGNIEYLIYLKLI
jgi:23S rRNA (cytidine1920-2'-O)/16S rRNA (cytidine1409-2'-O)-methyltransferase